MIQRPPSSTRTDTRLPYTTLFRSRGVARLVVEQGQARLEVFLLGAARRAIFDHDALGDARRFVDLFDQRLAVGQILILHDALLFGDQRHGERIPFGNPVRSEEHTSELQSLMRISYAVFCLKKKK